MIDPSRIEGAQAFTLTQVSKGMMPRTLAVGSQERVLQLNLSALVLMDRDLVFPKRVMHKKRPRPPANTLSDKIPLVRSHSGFKPKRLKLLHK